MNRPLSHEYHNPPSAPSSARTKTTATKVSPGTHRFECPIGHSDVTGLVLVGGSEPGRTATGEYNPGCPSRIITAHGTVLRDLWREEEDQALLDAVKHHGARNWAKIASLLPYRTSKQCRERWHNHVDPNVRKGPFTPEEDQALLWLFKSCGPKWAKIAAHIPGRTDNAVKNRFNTCLKRRIDAGTIQLSSITEPPKDFVMAASLSPTSSTSQSPPSAPTSPSDSLSPLGSPSPSGPSPVLRFDKSLCLMSASSACTSTTTATTTTTTTTTCMTASSYPITSDSISTAISSGRTIPPQNPSPPTVTNDVTNQLHYQQRQHPIHQQSLHHLEHHHHTQQSDYQQQNPQRHQHQSFDRLSCYCHHHQQKQQQQQQQQQQSATGYAPIYPSKNSYRILNNPSAVTTNNNTEKRIIKKSKNNAKLITDSQTGSQSTENHNEISVAAVVNRVRLDVSKLVNDCDEDAVLQTAPLLSFPSFSRRTATRAHRHSDDSD